MEQARAVDRSEGIVGKAPLCGRGDLGGIAAGIDAVGKELHLCARHVDLVLRCQRGMVKGAGFLRGGDQQEGRGDDTFRAVGRVVLDAELVAALMTGSNRCGAAAVEIDRVNDALFLHHLGDLINGHTDGHTRTAVSQEGNDGTVRLQSDGVTRCKCSVSRVCHDLTVAEQEERAGDGFFDVVRRRAVVTDGIFTIFQNGKIWLGRAAARLHDVAFHDKIAATLRSLHIVVVCVRRHNNSLACRLFIVGCLTCRRAQVPFQVLRRLCTALGRAAFGIVAAVRSLQLHTCARLNGCHIAVNLSRARFVVQNDLRFRYALRQRIIRLRDDVLSRRGSHAARLLCRKGRRQK